MSEDIWSRRRIAEMCLQITSGGTPSRSRSEFYVPQGIPWLKTQEMLDCTVYDTVEHITEEAIAQSSAKLLPIGTVLVAMYGATAGQLAILGRPMACNQAACALIVNPDVAVARYLYYALWNDRSRLKSLANGAAQQNLSVGTIANLEISFPPLAEQRAIAEVLGALDDKIEANRRDIAIVSKLVTATWQQRFEFSKPNWPKVPFGRLAKVVGGSTPRTSVPEFWTNGHIHWATPKDLSHLASVPLLYTERKITKAGLAQISSGLLPPGTVLLSSRAPIGYVAIAEMPVAVNQGLIALIPGDQIPGLYLWQWLVCHLEEVKRRANGTTFLEISKASFRAITVAVPPREQLHQWNEEATAMYQIIVARERENRSLSTFRDTLLPKLMSGELRVRDAEHLVEDAV